MEEKAEENRYILEKPDGSEMSFGLALSGSDLKYRGKPILCSCTGKTQETATKFVTKLSERKLECPVCGKTLRILKTPYDFQKEREERERIARENIQIVEVNYSWETGITLYALSARLDRADWEKVKHLFSYWRAKPEAEDEEEWCDRYVGWATRRPEEVEKILGIPEERTLKYRKAEVEKTKKIQVEEEQIEKAKLKEVEAAFDGAEYPDPREESPEEASKYQPGFEKMRVEGKEIQHPKHPRDIYGGGEWFVIQEKWIWRIENNGADGDDWGRSNVETGGAGAIGYRVPFSTELAEKIRRLVEK